ncbi:MAG: C40 family peptidase, partial [Duncaniella sp.]|nr:C40 family peptidase [Duncaniella sp.]
SKTTRVSAPSYVTDTSAKPAKGGVGKKLDAPSEALLSEARSWLGVPYKYGGNDRRGVDCSGFVLQVYQKALDIPLPRSSREQQEYCKATTKGRLIPGDLIFFATDKDKERISHVGIFVGDNLMIHASTSKGVVISDLSSDYYTRTYAGSGIVERYHDMLGGKTVKIDKDKKKDKNKKETKAPASKEGPVIYLSQPEPSAGFSLTPVETLPTAADKPSPKTKANKKQAKESKAEPVRSTAVTTTAVTSSAAKTGPTVEDARMSVLQSIKEKEL